MTKTIRKEDVLHAFQIIHEAVWGYDIPSPSVPEYIEHHEQMQAIMEIIRDTSQNLPTENAYSVNEVACIIAELFCDNCACNFNDIDEWLGEVCEYRDTSCPDPGGVKCWEQYLIHKDKMR